MGTTTLQVNLNPSDVEDLRKIKTARGVPNKGSPGGISDDSFARDLLLEKVAAEKKSLGVD
jgi:hypothetical protein